MKTFPIAKGLKLPLSIVTQKSNILGMTGAGKSYLQTLLIELFLDASVQVVFLDPKGEAWGIRLMEDGKTPAYPIPVFGGSHGDLPLHPNMGKQIAEILVESDYSAILDVSEFISSELAQFGYDFATRLFQLKKSKPGAMSLMIDEAQDFIPQNPSERGMETKMLGAFERIGKQLRSKGVGMVIAGQRPQEINKKVLNMAECWFVFQMTGLQERETIQKIFRDKDREEANMIFDLLPTLEVGTAHVWSPRLLKVSADFEILKKKTYDSSATPEVGSRKVVTRTLSPVDVKSLSESMSAVIEKEKSNDPEMLRKRIKELERQLAQRPTVPEVKIKTVEIKVPVFKDGELSRLQAAALEVNQAIGDALKLTKSPTPTAKPLPAPTPTRKAAPLLVPASGESVKLPDGEKSVLIAIANYPGAELGTLALLTGFTVGSVKTYIGHHKKRGYVTDNREATQAGIDALGNDYEPLPAGVELQQYWLSRLSGGELAAFQLSLEKGGAWIEKQDYETELSEYTAGSIKTYLGRLKSRRIIEQRPGAYRAAPGLF